MLRITLSYCGERQFLYCQGEAYEDFAMNSLRDQILAFRERFRRLDRKWHLLIGSQLLVGMLAVRMRNQRQLTIDTQASSNLQQATSDDSKPSDR